MLGVEKRDGEIDLTVNRKSKPDQGSVTLTFADQPMQLRRWSVTDAQGQVTRILLADIADRQAARPRSVPLGRPQGLRPAQLRAFVLTDETCQLWPFYLGGNDRTLYLIIRHPAARPRGPSTRHHDGEKMDSAVIAAE